MYEARVLRAVSLVVGSPRVPDGAYDPIDDSHLLFAVRPRDPYEGRRIPVAVTTSNQIRLFLSHAAKAQAEERIKFYQTISEQAMLGISSGHMFELSWLATDPNAMPLD
jgi:hypothetical protein